VVVKERGKWFRGDREGKGKVVVKERGKWFRARAFALAVIWP
jgi:hypothetical protein